MKIYELIDHAKLEPFSPAFYRLAAGCQAFISAQVPITNNYRITQRIRKVLK